MLRLLTAREQEVDNGTTEGKEPDDKSPDDFLADGPVLLDEAEECKNGEQDISYADDGERAIGSAAATAGGKQNRGKQAQQECQRRNTIAKNGEQLHFRSG